MLTKSKKLKLLRQLKNYNKKYFRKNREELDESGTRLMINAFLTEVLGFTAIDEVKTEYMIRGTYADYVIQTKGVRHFLVEVKSLSLQLSAKHLRQTINYGANEGIEWALLTNGKQFDFYRILFQKPIESKLVFSFDLSNANSLKDSVEKIQFLHKEVVICKGLDKLWQKSNALDPKYISGLLFGKPVVNFIKRTLNKKFRQKFTEEEIAISINQIIHEQIELDDVKRIKLRKSKRKLTKSKTIVKEEKPKPTN